MFPILDARGNVIGFGGRVIGEGEPKYLNSPETPLFEKGRELYGLYQARARSATPTRCSWSRATWTSWRSRSTASSYAVATLGTATTPMHVQSCCGRPTRWSSASTATPPAARPPGARSRSALPVLADGKQVRFLFLPAEDDPDTYVRRRARRRSRARCAEAKPLSQFLFAELRAQCGRAHGRRAIAVPRGGKTPSPQDRAQDRSSCSSSRKWRRLGG